MIAFTPAKTNKRKTQSYNKNEKMMTIKINKKKAIIIIASISILVVVAAVATPIAVISSKKGDTIYKQSDIKGDKWNINQKISLDTDQIVNWKASNWGNDSRLITNDYTNNGAVNSMYDPSIALGVSKDVTTYFLLDSLVQMVINHRQDFYSYMDWRASLQIEGIHVRQSDHKFKIDSVHYLYYDRRMPTRKTDTYVWGKEWCSITGTGVFDRGSGTPVITTASWGSLDKDIVCWDVLSYKTGRAQRNMLNAPINFADVNACKFPESEELKISNNYYALADNEPDNTKHPLSLKVGDCGYDWMSNPNGDTRTHTFDIGLKGTTIEPPMTREFSFELLSYSGPNSTTANLDWLLIQDNSYGALLQWWGPNYSSLPSNTIGEYKIGLTVTAPGYLSATTTFKAVIAAS